MSTTAIQLPSSSTTETAAVASNRWFDSGSLLVATAVSAVGMGGVWRFPYHVSRHGGGIFVLLYLLALLLCALPILMAELMVGRRGRSNPAGCFGSLAVDEGRTYRWRVGTLIGGIAGLLMLSVLSGAGGWSALLLSKMVGGTRMGPLGWQGVLLGIAALFAARGLRWGIQPLQARLLPVILALLVGLLGYSALHTDELTRSLLQVFRPDFARLSWWGVVEAGRLALLTVGLGLGVSISYGAALPSETSILRSAAGAVGSTAVLVLVTAVALLSIVPTGGGFPAEGQILTLAPMPASAALYGVLLLATLGSAVAILHPLTEHLACWAGLRRSQAAFVVAGATWLIAGASSLAGGAKLVDWLGIAGTNLLLPAAALVGVLFVGWAMSRRATRMELQLRRGRLFVAWRWLIRYPVPAVLGGMLVLGIAELIS